MLGFSLALFSGCSKDSPSPVAATPTISQTPEFVTLPMRFDNALRKTVSVTKFFYASQGGTLAIHDWYRAVPDNHLVTIDISLTIRPYQLPYDASLTINIDDVAFLTDVDLTFGPHGIVFNSPVDLQVSATGLDLDLNSTRRLRLFYNNNGVWERMPGSSGSYYATFGWLNADGNLPHFSQYGFGRIDDATP